MNKIFVLFLFLSVLKVHGQSAFIDSTNSKVHGQNASIDSIINKKPTEFKYKSLLIPSILIGYGVIGQESRTLKDIDNSTKNEFREHDDKKTNIDDFSQYSPFLSVYALNAMGIQGKHNFKDRTIVLGTAYLIMGGSVNILKKTTKVTRPDGSSSTSFPSGHTATAFMGAEFLYQEYKDISVWYGVAGYVVAAGTGLFRMHNEKHWLTDVATGAGIGILSTKIAYWLHPLIKKTIFKDKEKTAGIVMPFYNGREYGLGLTLRF
ncbi:phosphatase PAP2 family protein [Maribacter sp. PR1]|uniref:Phosphatase PAP2 family protein n=1 Tax=Maribacter cobaltidurans TaxID=1178778 RepID=A0ABU7IYB1_9FLAO|nr:MULTISPECIES: phosphatase PAP2 family protein [Maribacter]MDC6390586.1 phosphatase PAP2 family protein [Maribacter sp. PR1]MEE1977977.1 phosphatase PAP2 family protein [Maribacter cobaltidurans]